MCVTDSYITCYFSWTFILVISSDLKFLIKIDMWGWIYLLTMINCQSDQNCALTTDLGEDAPNRSCSKIKIQNVNCNKCCSRIAWFKLIFILPLLNYYHFNMNKSKTTETDLGSTIFLFTTGIWLSALNLRPNCLRIIKPFNWIYDVSYFH